MHPRGEFFAGVRAEAPLLLGVVPFGLIFGALALEAGIPAAPALAMSSIVFAGSAQFVATQLFAAATPGPIMLLVTVVVNLRHMLYSTSLAPNLKSLSKAWKALLAYLLTDEAYAVAVVHYAAPPDSATARPRDRGGHRHFFFLGAGVTLWLAWQISTGVGILLGPRIPAAWNLEFALPLTFTALLRPTITDRATAIAAGASGLVAVLAASVPLQLGIVIAALAGIAAAMIVGRTSRGSV